MNAVTAPPIVDLIAGDAGHDCVMIAVAALVGIGQDVPEIAEVGITKSEAQIDHGSTGEEHLQRRQCRLALSLRQKHSILFPRQYDAFSVSRVTMRFENEVQGVGDPETAVLLLRF